MCRVAVLAPLRRVDKCIEHAPGRSPDQVSCDGSPPDASSLSSLALSLLLFFILLHFLDPPGVHFFGRGGGPLFFFSGAPLAHKSLSRMTRATRATRATRPTEMLYIDPLFMLQNRAALERFLQKLYDERNNGRSGEGPTAVSLPCVEPSLCSPN